MKPSIYGNKGHIKIVNSTGNLYFEAKINEQEKEFILDSSHWLMGMYYGIYTNQSGKHKIMPFTVYH